MNIILSTTNPSKAEQIKAIFNNPRITMQTLKEAGIEGEAVEDGETLEENAHKKALYALEHSGGKFWVMADDTGLFIKSLNGEPGIRAARWAGETATTEETKQYCIKRLEGVTDRSAVFETVVVLLSPKGEKYTFSGKVNGRLLESPRTESQPKMPYSSLFVPEGTNKVWAEMTVDEENAISHRGKAFRQVVEFLEKNNLLVERLKLRVAVYILLIKEGKILLSHRFNTGWQDGNYGLPAGHLELNETIIEALLREIDEEIGITLKQEDIIFAHTMHRKSNYMDLFFVAKSWVGEPHNMEPDKCDGLQWFSLDNLPDNMVPSVKSAIQNYQNGIPFSDFQLEE